MPTHRPKAGALLTGTEYESSDAHVEAVTTVAATGATETLSPGFYDLTLDQACTFTLSGATDDEAGVITAILRGAFGTTWPAEVTWLNGAPPAVSLRVVTLFSVDGANWLGTTSRVTGPTYDIERYTGGDITVSSTSAGADLGGLGDAVVAASAGDLLMIGASFRPETTNTSSLRFDVKFITGATENYVSSQGTTPSAQGISGWFCSASTAGGRSGEQAYVVQAADVSGGNVTCSLRAWLSGAQNWVIAADADAPLKFWVRNLGQ